MGKYEETIGEMKAKIDQKRKKLYEIANIKGLTSSEVLKCSEELDQMIFALQHKKCEHRK
ncbi:aspartyl-phosphate phosphatase Spo0E family protein [Virgibacillus senegalensis]|uniref:aspartyl-phosphate phosphatase Spo0E family protein n=1 Tax=Virgibacillus senegalensis TaxID=1499679 RepID=UPI00069DA67E|nr:aspartyl-phosphate phosphatase Spo0E family protein [Virgibacillus senegalensis]